MEFLILYLIESQIVSQSIFSNDIIELWKSKQDPWEFN